MDQFIIDKQKEYKEVAKRADRKLRELEKRAKKEGNIEYLRYAYSRAMRDIKKEIGGNKRFDKKPPDDIDELMVWLSSAKRFDTAITSTYRGFNKVNDKRIKKFNKSLGTDFSTSEFREIMENGAYDLLTQSGAILFKYRTAIRIIETMVKNNSKLLDRKRRLTGKQMVNLLRKFKRSDDAELYDIIQDKLSKYDR